MPDRTSAPNEPQPRHWWLRIRPIVLVVLTCASAACAALFALSLHRSIYFAVDEPERTVFSCAIDLGRITVRFDTGTRRPSALRSHFHTEPPYQSIVERLRDRRDRKGLLRNVSYDSYRPGSHIIGCPLWIPCAAFALCPAIALWRRVRAARRSTAGFEVLDESVAPSTSDAQG